MSWSPNEAKLFYRRKVGVGGGLRAVRVGHLIYVTGTVALEADGTPHAPGDLYAQAKRCIETIERALKELGGGLSDVVRNRIFVTDIGQWEAVGRAHAEAFGDIRPCVTMVEVQRLIAPEFLVEIESEAVLVS